MTTIAWVSALVAVLSILGATHLIVRPLISLTKVTERLAEGDMAPVVGFERKGGEIGRMALALAIFRDGMIAQKEFAEQERTRELKSREKAAQEEKDAQKRQKKEREQRGGRGISDQLLRWIA